MRFHAPLLLSVLSVAAITLVTAAGEPEKKVDPQTKPAAPGIAVIELFTSEGCSSCPPADSVLSALHAAAKKNGTRVYTLAFHVDYWDKLGWPDRFASADFTKRQYDYAAAFNSRSVYTPQTVVNGSAEFVGSDQKRTGTEIEKALSKAPALTVTATLATRKPGEPFTVEVSAPGAPAGSRICLALAEDGLVSDVKKGENAGRKLTHDGVVRAFAVVPIGEGKATKITLNAPADTKEPSTSLVAYVQEKGTLHVLGAVALATNPATKPATESATESVAPVGAAPTPGK